MPRRVAALGALLLAAVFAGSADAGPVAWTFADMKPPNGTLSYAFDVNLSGQATGVMTDESGFAPVYRGFFYDPDSGLVDIDDLGGAQTFAVALNDRGVVTGTSQTDKGAVHAFLYTPGVGMHDVGGGAFPSDISGTWSASGAFTPFASVPGPYAKGDALAGNIFGQATGRFTGAGGDASFVWTGTNYMFPAVQTSPAPPGVDTSAGQAINDAGVIAVLGTDADDNDIPLVFGPPYDTPWGSYDGQSEFAKILDITAIDDVGRLAGAGRLRDGEVHGFVMTPYFPLQASSAVSILGQGLEREDPFRTMAGRSLSWLGHGVSETACYQMKQLRKTLSVGNGTHFAPAQRSAAQDALAAVLESGECGNALPIAPTTVPHIFSSKGERFQFSVRLVRKHRISVFIETPPEADVVALKVPKKKVNGTVRVTVVARRLLAGGATPATITVR